MHFRRHLIIKRRRYGGESAKNMRAIFSENLQHPRDSWFGVKSKSFHVTHPYKYSAAGFSGTRMSLHILYVCILSLLGITYKCYSGVTIQIVYKKSISCTQGPRRSRPRNINFHMHKIQRNENGNISNISRVPVLLTKKRIQLSHEWTSLCCKYYWPLNRTTEL